MGFHGMASRARHRLTGEQMSVQLYLHIVEAKDATAHEEIHGSAPRWQVTVDGITIAKQDVRTTSGRSQTDGRRGSL